MNGLWCIVIIGILAVIQIFIIALCKSAAMADREMEKRREHTDSTNI